VTSRIQPGSDVIVCAEMDEQWGYVGAKSRQRWLLRLELKKTVVRSPESNGIAESFVKTIKRDYISIMPKPDGLMAAKNLAEAFEHYNEWHPHSALGYRSPREYLRQRASNGLSDNRCLEI
ncbi:IS1 family transposase, partial [Escherichia coli]|uniref:IS1 family transposase n=1 Tax=Escherichia coli TaxID=562 RepID=UPI00201FA2FA